MWYGVNVFMKSTVGEEEALWEELVYLIEADCEEAAEEQAKKLAEKFAEELSYKNPYDEEVRWEFDSIQKTYEILSGSPVSGTEVFSRFLEPGEAGMLKRRNIE